MRLVIQKVAEASVKVKQHIVGEIEKGVLLLVGIEENDGLEDIDWLCNKVVNMRIFLDEEGKMNLSLKDVSGEALIVSQFTLYASTKKGNRPSFIRSAKPTFAEPLYEQFKIKMAEVLEGEVSSGVFGANMKVSLINDGPITIVIDSKNKE